MLTEMVEPWVNKALERFDLLRQSLSVQRYHTQRIRPQSIGEHAAGVAEIVLLIRPDASAELITAALRHDAFEVVTGDIPAPAKWYNEELAGVMRRFESNLESKYKIGPAMALPEDDIKLIHWADLAELVVYCAEQSLAGNSYAMEVMDRGHMALNARDLGEEDQSSDGFAIMYAYIENLRKRVNGEE